jgi:integrase/recombinase XerD
LAFLKQERGFTDATIVNRERSLKPFLAWLVAQGVPLSAMSPVVITKYFTGAVAGKWKRTTVSFDVQSLRSFFRYASSRGWCAAGIAESIDAPPSRKLVRMQPVFSSKGSANLRLGSDDGQTCSNPVR